jgi:adenine-specific DNA glycosylase
MRKTTAQNKEIDRVLFWIEQRGKVLAWRRPANARLMPGFWELPEEEHLPKVVAMHEMGTFRHAITVHDYRIKVWRASTPPEFGNCQWLKICELADLPLSTIFKKALVVLRVSVGD